MPTTTTGKASEFITFSRTSNATVTDSDGKIKWAPHNLLLASEQFDSASWTKTSITPTANAVAAPNGTTTADTLTASGANGTTLQSYTSLGVSYTFGIWLKRKTGTGNIQIAADSGTYTTVTITSDWALYTVTQTPTAGSKSAGIRIVTSADAVEAWGAHLYLGGMQANTSAYPTYSPTTAKNLLGFTESLTTGWTNTNTTDSIALEVNPVGLTGAVDVAATAGNGTLLGSVSLLASPYTFSIYLKRKTGAGTVEITVDGTTYVAAAVTSTWTRFSTTLTPSAGTKTPGIRLVTSGDAVYAWGAQLSDSASLDAYVPNYGAAPTAAAYYGPRRDFDGATLACKGLLVEEQRANLLLHSAAFDNATSWFSTDATVTDNNSSPDGTTNAYKIVFTTTSGIVAQDYTTTTAGAYTASVYLRADSATTINLRVAQGPGGEETTVVCSITTSWRRFTVSHTAIAPTFIRFALLANSNTPTFYAYGAQLEAGAFATSYIPVGATTAGATRTGDVASVSTQAFPYSATEGTMVVNGSVLSTTAGNRGAFTLASVSGYISIGNNVSGLGATNADFYTLPAGTFLIASGAVTAGTPFKEAAVYKANNFALSVNGAAAVTSSSGALPTAVTDAYIGRTGPSSAYFNGHIRQITYLPRRITNTELQARTV